MIELLLLLAVLVAVLALVRSALARNGVAERMAQLADAAERLARPGEVAGTRNVREEANDALDRLARALERLAVRMAQEVAAVEAERRKLDDVLAAVPEGMLVAGSDRAPIYANRAFRELFDVGAEAPTSELLALVRRPQVHEAVARALAGEPAPAIELQIPPREVAVEARRLEGLDAMLLMARDVTAANRLTRMRRDFVTNLSHEIKTPLAIIRGAAETLRESGAEDPDATERFVRRIVEQIYRLEDLLEDLLTLARLESPEAGTRRQPLDPGAIAKRAVEVLQTVAERAGVELRAEVQSVPELAGDARALERMVLNLLVNAIQYNRRGGHVTLRLLERAGTIVLEVEDDGIGIPEAELPRIFERFYRVDKGRGRAEGGSGLGLAIVKHVAHSHGGAVEVTSRPERGSLFRVLLPAAPAPALAERSPEPGGGVRAQAEAAARPALTPKP